jgi:hypothetical protein
VVDILVAVFGVILALFAALQGADSAASLYDRFRQRRLSKIDRLSSQKVSTDCVMLEADLKDVKETQIGGPGFEVTIKFQSADSLRELVDALASLESVQRHALRDVSPVETMVMMIDAGKDQNENP